MKMDSLRTEMRSIIKLKDYLTRNHRLIPDIRDNDKTPSWDGEIIVYGSSSIAKENIVGRVPVQIKGSVKKNLNQSTIKYSLKRSDLRNYLSSNGVLVFVVYMSGYDDCKIYYNALLPFDIIKILDKMGKQKNKTIELKEFPKDNSTEILNIFLNFISNQRLQGGTVDRRILSLSDVEKLGIEIDGIHLGYTAIGSSYIDALFYSLQNPSYIYVQPKGLNIKVPVDKVNVEQISSDIEAKITVDGEVFYNTYTVLYEKYGQVLQIGNSFRFDLVTGKIHYKLSGPLSERITDVKFLIALISNKKIVINRVLLPQKIPDNNLDIENMKKHLYELEEIKKALNMLGVKKDLNTSGFTDKEFELLHLLVKAILYKEPVPLSINNMPGIGSLKIGNIAIKLICEKHENGNYNIYNFFGEHNLYIKFINKGKEVILSPYVQLKKEDFLTISNIDYSRIIKSIKNAPTSKFLDEFANLLVLEMLNAYDVQKEKDMELLKTAQEIMEWLYSRGILDSVILKLNRFQIVKRVRALSQDELSEILKIKQNTTDEAILLGANILLESFEEARLHYGRLSEQQRKEFDSYPISTLWMREDE